uniref:Kazal-like domain-containing protein n=1 Tax=Panagrellus redivivus TaxID=6233 RepID=A0A7E4URC6_PANRE
MIKTQFVPNDDAIIEPCPSSLAGCQPQSSHASISRARCPSTGQTVTHSRSCPIEFANAAISRLARRPG